MYFTDFIHFCTHVFAEKNKQFNFILLKYFVFYYLLFYTVIFVKMNIKYKLLINSEKCSIIKIDLLIVCTVIKIKIYHKNVDFEFQCFKNAYKIVFSLNWHY